MSETPDRTARLHTFGVALKAAREDQDLSQETLGRAIDSFQTRISSWETGRTEPEPHSVFALERTLDLPPGSLSQHLGYIPIECKEKRKAGEILDLSDLSPADRAMLRDVHRRLLARRPPVE